MASAAVTATAAPPDLLRQLEALADCPLAGECLHIRAQLPHQVKSLQIERPVLGLVLHGQKRLSTPQQQLQLHSGDLFLITGRSLVDVHNQPDPRSQRYLSMTLTLCDEVLQAARILWAQPLQADASRLVGFPASQVATTLQHWCQALQQGHDEQARVALVDLVMHLCRQGHHALLAPPPLRLADQVHQLVTAAPERRWQSSDVEAALHTSGATLRRKLAHEGTSLSKVLLDARMGRALELFYTTQLPVKTVAARVGYQSVPSFVRQFQGRYGMAPSEIGNVGAA